MWTPAEASAPSAELMASAEVLMSAKVMGCNVEVLGKMMA
jgi:hypothetical protein